MDAPLAFTFAGLGIFFIALLCFHQINLICRSRRSKGASLRLIPSPEIEITCPVAKHVDAAVRVAKEGFLVCQACEFTNPRRAATCVICSATLRAQPAWCKFAGYSKTGLRETKITKIQRRARRRREWTREVIGPTTIQWRKNLQTEGKAFVIQAVRCRNTIAITIDSSTAPTLKKAPPTPLAEAAVFVTQEFGNYVTTIAQADLADAACVAYATPTHRPTSASFWHTLEDSVNLAKLNFPTKLAQFVTRTALNIQLTSPTVAAPTISHIAVSRSTLLPDSIASVATMTPTEARAAVRVDFVEEQGIDAGGIYREWCLLLNRAIVTKEAGIFWCVDDQDQTFYLSPHSQEWLGETHLAHVFAAGRLLGRALLDGNVTGFHLALPLLKILLGLPVDFADLEFFDSEVHRNLSWLLANDGIDDLGLNFTVTQKHPDGLMREIELLPGGSDITVTDANKRFYVDRKLQYLLFESVAPQLFAFVKGFYEIVPVEQLVIFDAEELDYMLSGSDDIDVDDWETHADVSAILRGHPALVHFWRLVRELSLAERRALFQFTTGTNACRRAGSLR